MILTTILLIAILMLIATLVISIVIGGTGLILVFGDLILFIVIMVCIIKKIIGKHKKKSKK